MDMKFGQSVSPIKVALSICQFGMIMARKYSVEISFVSVKGKVNMGDYKFFTESPMHGSSLVQC